MNQTNLRLLSPDAPEQWDDQDIKQLARRDRRQAVDLVVRKYRDRLYYHALCIVREPQEAYDAVQEVFIKAIREPRFFDDDFQMKAWLFRVTSNLCFNIVRDRRRRSGLLQLRQEEATPNPSGVPAPQAVAQRQVRDGLLDAMQKLSPKHREILLLRYYQDLSYNEIAEVLGVRLGTVMSRLSRARGKLAEVLGPDHPLVRDGLDLQAR